jgi:hypothetical protein
VRVEFKETEWGRVVLVNGVEVGRVVDNVVSLDVYSPQYPWEGDRLDLGWAGSLIYSSVNLGGHIMELIGHEHDGVRELVSIRIILNGEVPEGDLASMIIDVVTRYMDKGLLNLIESRGTGARG